MAKVEVNFNGLGDSAFPLLPEGFYNVRVEKVVLKRSKKSLSQYLRWKFGVIDGEHKGRHLYFITSLREKALWRLKELLEIMGQKYNEQVELDLDKFKGTELRVEVDHEYYGGRKWNKIIGFETCGVVKS